MWHCPYSPAARQCCSNRSICPVPAWAHSSTHAAAGLLLWAHAGTDGRTDGQTGSANNAAFVIIVRQVAALAAQNVTKYTMIETLKTNTKLLKLLRNVSAHPTDEASGIMFSNCPYFCARVHACVFGRRHFQPRLVVYFSLNIL